MTVSGPLIPIDESVDEATTDSTGGSTEGSTEDSCEELWRSGMEPAHAARIRKLADAAQTPRHQKLIDAVITGQVNTTIAKTSLDTIDKIKAVLPNAEWDEIYDWLLTLGPGSGAKTVQELTKRILA